MTRFEAEGILNVVKSRDPKIPPRLQLEPSWRPPRDPETGRILPQGKLWDFTEHIASSRREGKNRRDGATVSTRVLRLTDQLGRKMFEEAAKAEVSRLNEEDRESFRSVREAKGRRRKGKTQGKGARL